MRLTDAIHFVAKEFHLVAEKFLFIFLKPFS